MKICIVGAGAIGGFIGTRLARSGTDVTALARGATAAALRAHGWRLQTGEGLLSAPARVAETAAELGRQDLVIVAVKGPSLAGVAAIVDPLLGPDTAIVSAMNGVPWWFFHGFGDRCEGMRLRSVDPDGRIEAALPARRVVGCVVHAACSTTEPGLARHHGGNRLIVGEPAGAAAPRTTAIAALLAEAGFDVEVSACIQRDIWYKLWGNMTMNPVSALTGATMDRILDDELVNGFCLAVMREAAAIGARISCPITQSGEDRNAVTRKLGAVKTSMLQDVEAHRQVEIDALLAAVREIGQRVQESTPALDALLGLARHHARVHGLYPS
jgi:2-dehydropantoate 2-reductase